MGGKTKEAVSDFVSRTTRFVRLFIALAVLTLLGYWLAVSASLKDRYQEHSRHYIATFIHEGDIDLVTIGSSRTGRIGEPVLLQQGLERKFKENNLIVYNYSKPGRDAVVDYAYLRDVLKQHCVGTVLFEINKSSAAYRINKSFDDITPYSIIWDSYLHDTFYSRPKRVQLALRSSMNKMFKSIYRRYGNDYQDLNLAKEPVRSIKRGAHVDVANVKKRPPDATSWDLMGKVEYRQTRYIFKILEEAEKYGTKVVFYYPPTSESQPLSREFLKEFNDTFGQPLHQLNQKQLNKMRAKRAYGDYNHVNTHGQKYMINWIVNTLDIRLARDAKCNAA